MVNNRCAVWYKSFNSPQMSTIGEYVGVSHIGGLGDLGHWLLKTNIIFGNALVYKENINSGQFSTTYTYINQSSVSEIGHVLTISEIG